MSPRILVSGASGPIGAALLPSLIARGYQVTRLVHGNVSGEGQIHWDPTTPLSPDAVSGFEAVIHLAGESIVGRWTDAKKKRILESRVLGTRNLVEALAKIKERPRALITASAIGYYGDRGDELLREESPSGQGFLPEVCRQWEAASQPAGAAWIRTVHMRTGLVLSPKGGALQKMLPPFRMGVGGNMGNGRQWWSWIDVQDWVGALHHILKTELLQGPVNVVAPNPVTNAEFTKTLASVLSRPAIFPMPAFAARLVLGQMADELLLASQRVEPAKLVASGYSFQFSELKKSLEVNTSG
ncbi:MAG TPA: TIGR01777 family oxidoreductase [Terriglobales bacterium]|nr:TIGR01777 family oxidoreductase [Terriglobales bacterium]